MKIVQIDDAKIHLSELVETVDSGSENKIILARRGRFVARLGGLEEPSLFRKQDRSRQRDLFRSARSG